MAAAELSADELLRVPLDRPDLVYAGDSAADKELYRKLAMRWHPDRNGSDSRVFTHVKALYEEAERRVASGTWVTPGVLRFKTTDGREFKLAYQDAMPFELGMTYVADKYVVQFVELANAGKVDHALRTLSTLTYRDDKMRQEFARYFPEVKHDLTTETHRVLVLAKTPDVLSLRAIIRELGQLPPRHVAWVISRLMNICCFLQYNGLTHLGLNLDSVFISPEHHSALLLGGWWHVVKSGQRIQSLPVSTYTLLTDADKRDKVARLGLNVEQAKAVAREALGDRGGSSLSMRADVPATLVGWLKRPAGENAVEQYDAWGKVLTDSFGPRKFVELKLTAADLYGDRP